MTMPGESKQWMGSSETLSQAGDDQTSLEIDAGTFLEQHAMHEAEAAYHHLPRRAPHPTAAPNARRVGLCGLSVDAYTGGA